MNLPFSSRRFFSAAPCWALAGILLFAAWSRAQDASQHMENRFLFVIDTSSAMKSRSEGVEQAVVSLFDSGMKGELRKGDTIGLWTYGDRLNTDFPRQVWSEEKKGSIVSAVRDYVRGLHYEKRSHLEKALPAINQVVAGSERLTVILVFEGTDPIKGTPFDKDINDLHKQYAREFRASHQPFVTLLVAHNHRFFDYTINYPGTVIVPHMADPLPPPETNAPPVVATVPPPRAETVPPPVEPKPAPAKIEIIPIAANVTTNMAASPPPVHNVVAVPATEPTPTPAPAPIPPPVSIPEPAPKLIPSRVAVTDAPPPVESAPVVVQAANTNVVAPEPTSAPAPAVVKAAPPPDVTNLARPGSTPAPPPSAPAAAEGSTPQQTPMIIMAISLLTIAVALVIFLVRRSRGGPQPSLISQSIDRSH